MALIATGIFKTLTLKKQTALGTKAPATPSGSATNMRRVTSVMTLNRANFKSKEILPTQQIRDVRLGIKAVTGTISGELTVGGYQQPMESVLRQVSQTVVTTGALTTVTAASTGTNTGTFTRSAGSFLTDGFKIGDVVTQSGWTTTGTANNAHNFLITALTATVMTVQTLDGAAVVAKTAGDSVTTVQAGKKTWTPQTGQSRDYYTIEHWYSDIAQSEQYTDCVFSEMSVKIPATAITDISFSVLGLNMQTGVTQYFSSPAAIPTGGSLAGVNGVVLVNGVAVATVTGLEIKVKGNYAAPGGVVGSLTDPDIYLGPVEVDGSATILFTDNTMRDLFIAETECSLAVALTANNTANSPFTAFVLPRVKFTDADKNDGPTGIAQTMPFVALENFVNGGAAASSLATTISIQDSAFV
jgi:hypothetical protein